MAIKMNNAAIKAALKSGALLAKSETEQAVPFVHFLNDCILAYHKRAETGLEDNATFKTLIKAAGITSQRASEMWSITQVGEYDCAPQLVKRFTEMKPSKSGMYFAACAIRGTGWFSAEGDCKSARIKIEKDETAAPSREALAKAIKSGMTRSNKPKVNAPKTVKERIATFLDWLDKVNNKGFQKDGKAVRALNNANLLAMFNAGQTYMSPKNVVALTAKTNGAKRKAA